MQSPSMVKDTVAPSTLFPQDSRNRALFAENFDATPFGFRHTLHEHPAFQLGALLAAAERCWADPKRAARSHFESGEADRNSWFGARPEGTTLVDALASIQSGSTWVILKRIHEDPIYWKVLEEIVAELSPLTKVDLNTVFEDPTMTIFITSPGRITPYHMDGETNFLLQIHGTKSAYIYDGRDPSVLPEHDLEKYWTGHLPKIDYPEALPQGHWQFLLEPGVGVFNPIVFPHWLQNGPDVSISVSINFKPRHHSDKAVRQTNYYLRRAGMRPTKPGQSAALDGLKAATFGRLYSGAHAVAQAIKARRG